MPLEEMNPYLYALVAQYEMLGMICLGKVPDPSSNETQCDLARAKMVIDTVEMLDAKMKGNLTETEDREMKRILTLLRLNYVEEVNRGSGEKDEPSTEPAKEEKSAQKEGGESQEG